jgi:hypothetical protein
MTLYVSRFTYDPVRTITDSQTSYPYISAAQNGLMSIGLQSRVSGHPARADALIRFFGYVFPMVGSGSVVERKLPIIGSNFLDIVANRN